MLSYTPLGMPWKKSGMSEFQDEAHSQGASSSMVGFFTKRMSLRPLRICVRQQTQTISILPQQRARIPPRHGVSATPRPRAAAPHVPHVAARRRSSQARDDPRARPASGQAPPQQGPWRQPRAVREGPAPKHSLPALAPRRLRPVAAPLFALPAPRYTPWRPDPSPRPRRRRCAAAAAGGRWSAPAFTAAQNPRAPASPPPDRPLAAPPSTLVCVKPKAVPGSKSQALFPKNKKGFHEPRGMATLTQKV
jgi:hypothetical protein